MLVIYVHSYLEPNNVSPCWIISESFLSTNDVRHCLGVYICIYSNIHMAFIVVLWYTVLAISNLRIARDFISLNFN